MNSTLNILIVDDNASARTFVRRCLEGWRELTILEAASVQETFEKSSDVHLILLDWVLPGENGAAFLKAFRESGKRTPVLVISGRSDKETVLQALQLGANGYIRKPFTREMLLEKISSCLDTSRFSEDKKFTDYEYFFRLAKKKIEEKDHGAALHYLNKAIEIEPHLMGLYKVRGELFAMMGRYAESEKDLKRTE